MELGILNRRKEIINRRKEIISKRKWIMNGREVILNRTLMNGRKVKMNIRNRRYFSPPPLKNVQTNVFFYNGLKK